MTHYLAHQLNDMLDQIQDVKIEEHGLYKTTSLLLKYLVEAGLDQIVAARVVGQINIQLPEDLEDELVESYARKYSTFVMKIFQYYLNQFGYMVACELLIGAARNMSLVLE